MSRELQVATLADTELWDLIHDVSGMPSHCRSYASALTHCGIDTKLALVQTREGGMVLPFFERSWQGKRDICTWLSVSGARLWGDPREALSIWRAEAKARKWVAGYIQVEPESALPLVPQLTEGNTVFLLNLDLPDPLSQASQIVRRKVRYSDANGVRLVQDRKILSEVFIRLYPEAMARVGASAAYALSESALRALVDAPSTRVFGAALEDGRVECVMVFPVKAPRAEFFVGASTPEGRGLSAWLIAQAIKELSKIGVQKLNLGGGIHPEDGLFEFKARFGGIAKKLHSIREIYDPIAYRELCDNSKRSLNEAWFPAYRSPEVPF